MLTCVAVIYMRKMHHSRINSVDDCPLGSRPEPSNPWPSSMNYSEDESNVIFPDKACASNSQEEHHLGDLLVFDSDDDVPGKSSQPLEDGMAVAPNTGDTSVNDHSTFQDYGPPKEEGVQPENDDEAEGDKEGIKPFSWTKTGRGEKAEPNDCPEIESSPTNWSSEASPSHSEAVQSLKQLEQVPVILKESLEIKEGEEQGKSRQSSLSQKGRVNSKSEDTGFKSPSIHQISDASPNSTISTLIQSQLSHILQKARNQTELTATGGAFSGTPSDPSIKIKTELNAEALEYRPSPAPQNNTPDTTAQESFHSARSSHSVANTQFFNHTTSNVGVSSQNLPVACWALCGASFPSSSAALMHVEVLSPVSCPSSKPDVIQAIYNAAATCEECHSVIDGRYLRELTLHKDIVKKYKGKAFPFTCPIEECGSVFQKLFELFRHIEVGRGEHGAKATIDIMKNLENAVRHRASHGFL